LKPTKTINRLHFEDLDPIRFEDLCLALVYRLNRWFEIEHYGRQGKDLGIDILAIEDLEGEIKKEWIIQCKRYKDITKKQLAEIVDKLLERRSKAPDILLLIISCDLSKDKSEYFKKYAMDKGIATPLIWTASILETRLYTENKDLLFSYFGISLAIQERSRIATIRRNIKLKQRMRKDFIKSKIDYNKILNEPWEKFENSNFLIRSINDMVYPDIDENQKGISSWFRVETYDFYHNGLEIITGIREIIMDEDRNWDLVDYYDNTKKEEYTLVKAYEIGRIPYENIIEYDLSGDEYYNFPHIFCDFKNDGEPYEDIVYSVIMEEQRPWRLDNKNRKTLK